MSRGLGASGFYYIIDSLTPVRKAVKIAIYKILDLCKGQFQSALGSTHVPAKIFSYLPYTADKLDHFISSLFCVLV